MVLKTETVLDVKNRNLLSKANLDEIVIILKTERNYIRNLH